MKTAFALCLSLCFLSLLPVQAQSFDSEFSGSPNAPDPNNPLAPQGGLGIFDLIHRSNLSNPKSFAEFKKENSQNLADEVAKFRARSSLKITPTLLRPAPSEPEAPASPLVEGTPDLTPKPNP